MNFTRVYFLSKAAFNLTRSCNSSEELDLLGREVPATFLHLSSVTARIKHCLGRLETVPLSCGRSVLYTEAWEAQLCVCVSTVNASLHKTRLLQMLVTMCTVDGFTVDHTFRQGLLRMNLLPEGREKQLECYVALWVHFNAACSAQASLSCCRSPCTFCPSNTLPGQQSKQLPAFRLFQGRWNSSCGEEEKDSWSEEDELFSDAGKLLLPINSFYFWLWSFATFCMPEF